MRPRASLRSLLPVVGITGAVGTGKSQIAAMFEGWGGILISGDGVGKDVVDQSPRLRDELIRVFGDDIIRRGNIDRSLLAQRAFVSPTAADQLNRIVHPHLLKELNRRIQGARQRRQYAAVVVDAALLAEWGPKRVYWDCLIGVWAPLALRQRRLRRRGWTNSEIAARSRCQMSWIARRSMADYVVKNDGSLTLLKRRARLCWEKILSSHCGAMP